MANKKKTNKKGTLKVKKKPTAGLTCGPIRMAIFTRSEGCRELELRWKYVGHLPLDKMPNEFMITCYNLNKTIPTEFRISPSTKWEVPLHLTPGHRYKFVVQAKRDGEVVAEGKIFHKAVLTKREIYQLLERGKEFLRRSNDTTVRVHYFYRNKPGEYYENIRWCHRGIMEPYIKDQNGDQGSPINGKIMGLFFSTKVDPNTGLPPRESPFGNTRLNIPVDRLMHTNCRIYFADFYCNFNMHYVTLVITEKGSETDLFCQENLIDIGMHQPNNPFLFYDDVEDYFYCCTKLWVEVLYTEAIDINQELAEDPRVFFSHVPIRGKGSSSPLGLPKNDQCLRCNLFTDRDDEF